MRLPFLRAQPEPDAAPPARKRSDRARSASPEAAASDVSLARTRARQRLVGALVLLATGVVGFPLLFETQPRPLPMDIPIRMPAGEMTAAPTGHAAPALRPLPVTALPPDAGSEIEAADPAASAATPRTAVQAAASAPVAAAVQQPVQPAAAPPAALARASAPAVAPAARPVATTADGARAAALLSGAASAPAAAGRFVVQVGAYTDARTLREARSKVEKLGLQTYTQVVENDAGKRTRVRLGPYATRDEAEAAAAKLKRAGLPANILAL